MPLILIPLFYAGLVKEWLGAGVGDGWQFVTAAATFPLYFVATLGVAAGRFVRLAASVVIEQDDEWLIGRRYLSAHSTEPLLQEEKEQKNVLEEVPAHTTA